MRRSIFLAVPVALLAGSLFSQQADPTGAPPAPVVQHGLPGQTPGTERWLVQFERRSFDLQAFRAANLAGDVPRVKAIVQDLERKVQADQAPFAEAIEQLGGKVVEQWWIVNACAIDVPFEKLDAVRALPNVTRLEPDEMVFPVIKTATNAANHNSDAANASGYKGAGVATAIVDTGQDEKMGALTRPHRTYFQDGDLTKRNRLVANKKIGAQPADDVHGHGTGVAGIAAGGNWGLSTADNGHAPHADIVGYAIADSTSGGSQFTTIVRAWQAVAADAVQLKIKTANNSYSGSPSPLHTSQQALDSAAYNADVLIVVAAGNSGASTTSSQSCANGIAVAALNATSHTVASFSSRGPLSGDTQRFYPDIAGCGVSTQMPRRNSESANYVGSGTSMASPQVCGAGTLIRAQDTKMIAMEAKAALLASALDISGKNPSLNRNAYGVGIVKDDNATSLVKAGIGVSYGRAKLTSSTKTWTKIVPTTIGKSYRFVAAWMRQVMTSTNWSNLDVEVRLGSTVVASSKTTRNLYELAGWTAKAPAYVVAVTATTLEGNADQEFGWAFVQGQAPPVVGTYTVFGQGCKGSGQAPAGGPVSPKAYATKWGESANTFPHGRANMRYQQLHAAGDFPNAFVVQGLAFRLDERFGGSAGAPNVEILMGYSTLTPGTMSTSFATNVKASTSMTSVFKGVMNYPAHTGNNTNLKAFAVKRPFTRPWPYVPANGNLLWEFVNSGGSAPTHFFDWARSATATVRRVWAFSTTAATGSRDSSPAGLVTQFMTPGGPGAVPALSNSGVPEVGQSFQVTLAQARISTQAILWLGLKANQSLPGGCTLLTSPLVLLGAFPTGAGGSAAATLSIPNDKALISAQFANQWWVLDPQGALLSALALSNGGEAKVGGQP